MSFDEIRRVADAVLFEGYMLYPYRASAPKNQLRFQFGVLAPRAFSEAGGPEAWWMETQCLVEKDVGVAIEARLRFLRIRRRRVEADRGGGFVSVDSMEVDGRLLVPWDEGEICEIDAAACLDGDLGPRIAAFDVPQAIEIEPVVASDGSRPARLVRTQEALGGAIRIDGERTDDPRLVRIRVRVENLTTPGAPGLRRDDALARSFLGAHLMLAVRGGAFVSLLDPPAWARAAAASCESTRTYPVLAGEPGARDLVLSAPIILYDHPRIAPESPGDLFDATEIDEILTLRTMLLTDDEKRQSRATDARVAAILDRIDALSPEQMGRLHGAVRDLAVVEAPPSRVPPPARETPSRAIRIGSDVVGPGTRVRLRSGARRTDAQDMFLDGLVATVERVERDVDDRDCLAVTVDSDPAAELLRWHGRYLYFYPDEVEVLDPGPTEGSAP